jgi:hypothetical protein
VKSESRQFGLVTLWFYVVGLVFLFAYYALKDNDTVRSIQWELLGFSLLGVAVFFANSIYRKIKPSWGGGLIVPVVVHFSHQTSFSSSLDTPAYLIDETERGYYLTQSIDSTKSTFIPREAIASIDSESSK